MDLILAGLEVSPVPLVKRVVQAGVFLVLLTYPDLAFGT